jgi:hypothetical protein
MSHGVLLLLDAGVGFLRFRDAAAFGSTAHTRHDEVPHSVLTKAPRRFAMLFARRTLASACRGPPSVFTVERMGRMARSPHRCHPLLATAIYAFISVVKLFLGGKLCDPRRRSPNRGCRCRPVMTRHRRTPWGRRHG